MAESLSFDRIGSDVDKEPTLEYVSKSLENLIRKNFVLHSQKSENILSRGAKPYKDECLKETEEALPAYLLDIANNLGHDKWDPKTKEACLKLQTILEQTIQEEGETLKYITKEVNEQKAELAQ